MSVGDRRPEPEGSHPLELALRHGLRYSGLRQCVIDVRLLLYVPLNVCEQQSVLPLSLDEDVLQIATVAPDPDLEAVLARFPSLAVELVLAPAPRLAELIHELKVAL